MPKYYEDKEVDNQACAGIREDFKECLLQHDCVVKVSTECPLVITSEIHAALLIILGNSLLYYLQHTVHLSINRVIFLNIRTSPGNLRFNINASSCISDPSVYNKKHVFNAFLQIRTIPGKLLKRTYT